MSNRRPNYLNIGDLLYWMALMDITNETKTAAAKEEKKAAEEKKEDKLSLDSAQFTCAFLKSLPKDLRKMFTPKNDDDLAAMEMRLIQFPKKEKEREQVIRVQKQFGLPLRPNMTLEKVAVYARIAMLKKERQKKYREDNYRDPEGGQGPGSSM